jgi:hypothetical protein
MQPAVRVVKPSISAELRHPVLVKACGGRKPYVLSAFYVSVWTCFYHGTKPKAVHEQQS